MVVSYVVVDKQCAWQQDRSPEGSDGPHCVLVQGWTTKLQCIYEWLLMVPGDTSGRGRRGH